MSKYSLEMEFFTRERTEVIMGGHLVPYLNVIRPSEEGGDWHVVLDDRFGLDCTEEELARWIPFVANAMAVAAGRSSHGENSYPINRHGDPIAGYVGERIEGTPVEEVAAGDGES